MAKRKTRRVKSRRPARRTTRRPVRSVRSLATRPVKTKPRDNSTGGMLFVGFLVLGIAAGIYYNQTSIGALVGLALGFIAMAIAGKK